MEGKAKSEMEAGPRDICERTFAFSVNVVKLCSRLEEKPGTGRTLGRQLLRAATSVGANVEEAQGGQSRADFISKCAIARKEARETLYWLRLLTAADIVNETETGPLLRECDELIAILTAIIKKAQANKER